MAIISTCKQSHKANNERHIMEYKTSLDNGEIKINIVVETGKHKTTVKMFDSRYAHTTHGQFISEHFIETLREGKEVYNGLNLDMSCCPQWYLSAQNIADLHKWLNKVAPTK